MRVKKSFDNFWKAEALKLAAQEQLALTKELDTEVLFKRARLLYIEGYRQQIHEWDSLVNHLVNIDKELEQTDTKSDNLTEGVNKEPVKETIKVETEAVSDTHKKCPKCGELVPINWPKHLYKKDGKRCGYAFN